MQEVVAGLSGKTDKLYAAGLHVAGERYVLTKAEDRSLYARKVCSLCLFYSLPAKCLKAASSASILRTERPTHLRDPDLILTSPIGQGRYCHCQDHTSYPHWPLQRDHDCRELSANDRKIGGLPYQHGLLGVSFHKLWRLG
jgi:hypothetical protein